VEKINTNSDFSHENERILAEIFIFNQILDFLAVCE
jgi:hypothetical protein